MSQNDYVPANLAAFNNISDHFLQKKMQKRTLFDQTGVKSCQKMQRGMKKEQSVYGQKAKKGNFPPHFRVKNV